MSTNYLVQNLHLKPSTKPSYQIQPVDLQKASYYIENYDALMAELRRSSVFFMRGQYRTLICLTEDLHRALDEFPELEFLRVGIEEAFPGCQTCQIYLKTSCPTFSKWFVEKTIENNQEALMAGKPVWVGIDRGFFKGVVSAFARAGFDATGDPECIRGVSPSVVLEVKMR